MITRKEMYEFQKNVLDEMKKQRKEIGEKAAYGKIAGIAKFLGPLFRKAGHPDLESIVSEIQAGAENCDEARTSKALALLEKQGKAKAVTPIMGTVKAAFMSALKVARASKETKESAENMFRKFEG